MQPNKEILNNRISTNKNIFFTSLPPEKFYLRLTLDVNNHSFVPFLTFLILVFDSKDLKYMYL